MAGAATVPDAPDAPVRSTAGTTSPGPAAERMLRNVYLSCGIGGLVFAALLLPRATDQLQYLRPVYGEALILVGLIAPISLAVLARWAPLRVMRAVAGATVITFAVLHLIFPLCLTDGLHSLDGAPWLQGINALHAVIATVVWQNQWVWLYGVAQAPIVMVTQMASRAESAAAAFQDAIGGTLYALILMGMSLAVVRTAAKVDEAAGRARDEAAAQARAKALEREENRINAIVHDDVMSVLYAAAGPSSTDGLQDRAAEALEEIERLAEDVSPARDYLPEELVAMLRSTALDASHDVRYHAAWEGDERIPSDVAVAISEALGEALRNSLRHAGPAEVVTRRVEVDARPSAVNVTCVDDGEGFDGKRVSTRRLGIRVSIIDRMSALEGGAAGVSSALGEGTSVYLRWKRP
ncbi:sensor histidine kinase [Demequina salsinemoris]|uniref:sensor histidine kinase n=1 Tax=Demequina salsinemoris TaxID=577470 RepID=UPI0007860A74|nr:ATP-binding protein [Demequina salsinemoris]